MARSTPALWLQSPWRSCTWRLQHRHLHVGLTDFSQFKCVMFLCRVLWIINPKKRRLKKFRVVLFCCLQTCQLFSEILLNAFKWVTQNSKFSWFSPIFPSLTTFLPCYTALMEANLPWKCELFSTGVTSFEKPLCVFERTWMKIMLVSSGYIQLYEPCQ